MNLLAKSAIGKGTGTKFLREGGEEKAYSLPYPIKGVKDLAYSGIAKRYGKYAHIKITVSALLLLEDSYDASIFEERREEDFDFDVLDEEDETGEGYIVEGASIDLDELSIRLMASSLPIKVLRPGSKLPEEKGIFVVGEEKEAEEEVEEKIDHRWDRLNKIDL